MRPRTATASLLTAAALALAPVSVAVAEDVAVTKPGTTTSAEAKAKAAAKKQARKLEKVAKTRGALVLGGTVTAVATAVTAVAPAVADQLATVTLTVKGGRYKVLRGQAVTVEVLADAKVTRGDADATVADLLVGDHVVVKSWRFDFVLEIAPAARESEAPVVTVVMKAHRVAASPAETETEVVAPTS